MLPKYHKKMGHDVYVIAGLDVFDQNGKTTYLNKGKEYEGDYQIKVSRMNFRGNIRIAKKLKNYNGVYEKLNQISPDIVFVHNCQFICINQVTIYLKEHPGVLCYVDNHADFSNSATNWISKKILHGIIWKRCAHLIQPYVRKFYGVLPARVDFLVNVYGLPREKCELLVMGADDDLVEKANNETVKRKIRNRYDISEDDFLIMTGGKIDSFKKQTLLLMDAVNQINNPKVKLIVFGSVTKELKEEVNIRCSKYVKYIGWQRAEDSYPLFGSCDLACFPGRHSVFWEQVAGQGIPMVCKKWEGTTHVDLGGNVRFLFHDSVEEIEHQLRTLIDNEDQYQQMKSIAKKRGMKEFSYQEIAKRSIGE